MAKFMVVLPSGGEEGCVADYVMVHESGALIFADVSAYEGGKKVQLVYAPGQWKSMFREDESS